MKAESKYETWQGKFRNLRLKFQHNYFFVTAQIVEIYIEYMYIVCEYKKKTGKKASMWQTFRSCFEMSTNEIYIHGQGTCF